MNNWAIVIGVNYYEHLLEDQNLRFAVRDAEKVRDFLRDEAGFPSENILFCTDNSEPQQGLSTRPTVSNLLKILNRLHHFLDRTPNSLWFFFAGHGIRYNDDDYILPCDALIESLQTTISTDFIAKCLVRSQAQSIIMILDMCRDNAPNTGTRGVGERTAEISREQRILTIFSCKSGERSYEISELEQGAFTYSLLKGLQEYTILAHLEKYLRNEVPKIGLKYGKPRQNPWIIVEPHWKFELPLLPIHATKTDITNLISSAKTAQLDKEFEKAENLWWAVIAASPSNEVLTEARYRIEQIQEEGGGSQKKPRARPSPTFSITAVSSSILSFIRSTLQSAWQNKPWNYLLLVTFFIAIVIVNRWNPDNKNPTQIQTPIIKTLTPSDIKNFQKQISVGETILATSEGVNRPLFLAAKEQARKNINKGDYQNAIKALEPTRNNPNAPEFYMNAPETLIYLNNAYIGYKPSYTIAVAAPLSQQYNYGLGVLRGVALAQHKINNQEGGIKNGNSSKKLPLKVLVVDDQNNPNEKIASFLSSLSINVSEKNPDVKILGLIGHQTSDLTLKFAPIYQEAGLPVITPSSTSEKIFGNFTYVHPISSSTYQMVNKLAQKITQTKVTVLYDFQEEFSRAFGTGICNIIGKSCVKWLLDEYPVVDVRHVQNEIDNGSTALVIAFNPNKSLDNRNKAYVIIEAVSKFNANHQNKIELFAGNVLSDQNLREYAKAKEVSIATVDPWSRDLDRNLQPDVIENSKQFLLDNNKLWNTDQVNWFTLGAYNATRALVAAIEASQSSPPISIEEVKAMRENINHQFISGTFSVHGALGEIHFAKEGYVDKGNYVCLSILNASTNIPTDCQSSESFPIK